MKKTRLICLLLVFLLGILPLFVTGCADKENNKNFEELEEDGELPDVFNGEQKNFHGATFRVLTNLDRSANQAFNIVDLVVEDNLGDDAIKTAVERRNERIKKNFGVEIERVLCVSSASADAQNNIQKGDYEAANVYMPKVTEALRIASGGALVDLNYDVEYIDLSQPYWDGAIIESLLLFDGAYFCLGDINTVDNDATWCVLFNKSLWDKYNPGDPSFLYDKVNEGAWTTELLQFYAKKSYTDDDGAVNKWDMTYSGSGTYGLYLQDEVATVLLQASGNTPTKITGRSGIGVQDNITGNTDFMDAITKIYEFMGGAGNDKWLVNFNKGSFGSGDIWADVVRAGFKANKALFFICHCGSINLMRDMEDPFGILPIPKLNENQDKYGNTIQYGNATCYIIPYNPTDEDQNEMAAYVLEAMAYYSSNEFDEYIGEKISLTNAYYDTVLKRKASRDDESWDMLDLVFDNRVFDLACALDISNINSIVVSNTTGTANNFASSWAGSSEMMGNISKQLEKIIQSQ